MPHHALLIAHGSPLDPAPLNDAIEMLAIKVAARLDGWTVKGVTLAAPNALEMALGHLTAPLIFPFFMAEGWFTAQELPHRLRQAGAGHLRQLAAFGSAPDLPDFVAQTAQDSFEGYGMDPRHSTLFLAAHGSQRSRASAQMTYDLAAKLRAMDRFGAITCGFIEETPDIRHIAHDLVTSGQMSRTVCLPLFAMSGNHVAADLPDALRASHFSAPLLPPIGQAKGIAAFIAAQLQTAAPQPQDRDDIREH